MAYIGLPRGPVTRIAPPYAPESGFRHSAWGGQKVMWVFRGFSHGDDPADVLYLGWMDAASQWVDAVALVRLKGPGCYAYDITAAGVHETIVFRAVIWDVH